MSAHTIRFVQEMVDRFPCLKSSLNEHSQAYSEILPHVFLGEISEIVAATIQGIRPGISDVSLSQRELRDLLDFFEATFETRGDEIKELIAVSFLENLPGPTEGGSKIREKLGPNLTKQLNMIWPT